MINLWILIRDSFIFVISFFFHKTFIRLFDRDDNEYRTRMIRVHKNNYGAWRVGLGISFVVLLDDGVVVYGSYVERWEPHILFQFHTKNDIINKFPEYTKTH